MLGTVWRLGGRCGRGNPGETKALMQCKAIIAGFCIPLANRRSLVSRETFIVSTFFARCEIGCHPPGDYGEK
jgi:hypothetical protein